MRAPGWRASLVRPGRPREERGNRPGQQKGPASELRENCALDASLPTFSGDELQGSLRQNRQEGSIERRYRLMLWYQNAGMANSSATITPHGAPRIRTRIKPRKNCTGSGGNGDHDLPVSALILHRSAVCGRSLVQGKGGFDECAKMSCVKLLADLN